MSVDELLALAIEALVPGLHGPLGVAMLAADVGAMLVEAGHAELQRKGRVSLTLKVLAMPSALRLSRESVHTNAGPPQCEAYGHEVPRAPVPPTRPSA